jgi:hypothetical protein
MQVQRSHFERLEATRLIIFAGYLLDVICKRLIAARAD